MSVIAGSGCRRVNAPARQIRSDQMVWSTPQASPALPARPRRTPRRGRARWCRASPRPPPGAAVRRARGIHRVAGAHLGLHLGQLGRSTPLARSSSQRRRARSARLAVTNSFTGASGKITVPMSRPSSTAPRAAAKPRWKSSSAARTAGMAATAAGGGIGRRAAQVGALQVLRLQARAAAAAAAAGSAGSPPASSTRRPTARYSRPVSR